ncbi:MAG TPA: DUF1206 domain-containing protein [Herpetosiphonaceae bacterium]
MGQVGSSVREAAEHAEQAARQAAANPWVERLARLGFAAKGVVYITIGVLATQAALGAGGATTDPHGAIRQLGQQPFGQVLLGLLAVGLLGHALWRFVQAATDPEHKGSDAKGIAQRVGYAGLGVVYVGLAVTAIRLLTGADEASGDMTQDWTARLMSQPFGRWLVGLIGLGVIGFGLYELYQAYTTRFRKKLKVAEMSATEESWAIRSGRFGLAARGVVFGIIGSFLVQAALQYNPDKAQGLSGALQALARQPFGPWLLGVVAAGLVAYGVYMLVEARYRRIFTG